MAALNSREKCDCGRKSIRPTLRGPGSVLTRSALSFDQRAAIELAAMNLAVRTPLGKRAAKRADAEGTWAKISYDRQIVAIAKTHGANTIYSDDQGLAKFARKHDIALVHTWELELPAEALTLWRARIDRCASGVRKATGPADWGDVIAKLVKPRGFCGDLGEGVATEVEGTLSPGDSRRNRPKASS